MRKISLILFLIAIVLLVGCANQQAAQEEPKAKTTEKAASSPQAPDTVSVSIKGFKFVPQDITVKAGMTVTWTNEDSAPHTVESSDGTLRSGELSKGDSWSYKFDTPGTYDYICGIHPSMKGSVTVQ